MSPQELTTSVEFREFFKTNYGPTIAVYGANESEQRTALDDDFERFLTESDARVPGTARWAMEYLVFTARKA